MSETALQRRIRRHLQRRGFLTRKLHGSAYAVAGDPDILAIRYGQVYAIETKQPGEDPTPIQRHRLRQWQIHGAIGGVARSLSDALRIVGLEPESPAQETRSTQSGGADAPQPEKVPRAAREEV